MVEVTLGVQKRYFLYDSLYDLMGNVLTAIDEKGTVITDTYDKAGRVETRTYSN